MPKFWHIGSGITGVWYPILTKPSWDAHILILSPEPGSVIGLELSITQIPWLVQLSHQPLLLHPETLTIKYCHYLSYLIA